MNLKRYLVYSLLGCLLVSCGESGEEYPSSGIPIDFSCDVLTRGVITTDLNIASMGVAAFFHSDNFDASGIVEPNFMKNQLMKKEGGSWTYTPVKYWPEGNEQKISFFAYSPYSDEINGLSLLNLQLSYVTPESSQNHPDLLIAMPQKNQEQTTSAIISFAFTHILARVSFTFEVASQEEVSQVKLSGIKTKGDISLDNGTWSIDESTTGTVSCLYNSANGRDYMMLLPQLLTADVKLSFLVGGVSNEVALSDYDVPQWEQGLAYNYNIIIENKK